MQKPLHCAVTPVFTYPSDDTNRTSCMIMDGSGRFGRYLDALEPIFEAVVPLIQSSLVRTTLLAVLSRENCRERPLENLEAIREAVEALEERIRCHGDLVRDGIRTTVGGDLSLLAERGPEGARLVDALLRVARAGTIEDRAQRGELVILGGYPPDVAISYGASYMFRSGLEDASIVRTSGLDIPEGCLLCSTDKLWPDVSLADIAEPYFTFLAQNQPFFEPLSATSAVEVVERVCALPMIKERGLYLSLPVSMREAKALLQEALRAGSLPDNVRIVLASEGEAPCPLREAHGSIEVDVVMVPMSRRTTLSSARLGSEFDFIIAANQTHPAFRLGGLRPGYAQVVGSGKRPVEIASAIASAVRYREHHSPLLGRSRQQVSRPLDILTPPDVQPEIARMAHYPALVGEVCSMLERTQERGLLPRWPNDINAYWNYGSQAFAIGIAHPDEEKRDECVRVAADYMLPTAAMDEKVGDAKEAPRLGNGKRLLAIRRKVEAALDKTSLTPMTPCGVQDVNLRLIHGLLSVSKPYEETAHPLLYQRCHQGFLDLLQGCADENRLDVVLAPAVMGLRRKGPLMSSAVESVRRGFRCKQITAGIRRRVDDLLQPALSGESLSEEACMAMAALVFLRRTAPTIGAGLLYRHLSLTFAAHEVTVEMITCFERSIASLDACMRFMNDLCGPERDHKETAVSAMVFYATDPQSEVAVMQRVSERVVAWLYEDLQSHVLDTLLIWPAMGRMLQRGVRLGRATYQRGHYTLIPRDEMLALVLQVIFKDRDSPT